jgi:hypothetical protein
LRGAAALDWSSPCSTVGLGVNASYLLLKNSAGPPVVVNGVVDEGTETGTIALPSDLAVGTYEVDFSCETSVGNGIYRTTSLVVEAGDPITTTSTTLYEHVVAVEHLELDVHEHVDLDVDEHLHVDDLDAHLAGADHHRGGDHHHRPLDHARSDHHAGRGRHQRGRGVVDLGGRHVGTWVGGGNERRRHACGRAADLHRLIPRSRPGSERARRRVRRRRRGPPRRP